MNCETGFSHTSVSGRCHTTRSSAAMAPPPTAAPSAPVLEPNTDRRGARGQPATSYQAEARGGPAERKANAMTET